MTEQVTCTGCAARFRVRLHSPAGVQSDLACPRCGNAISLRTTASSGEVRGTSSTDTGSVSRPDRRRRPDRVPQTDGPANWRSVEYADVFGRPTPPPPAGATRGGNTTADPPRAGRRGVSDRSSSSDTDSPPRLPEADRPDGNQPLAEKLLRRLDERRGEPDTAATTTTASVETHVSSSGGHSPTFEDETGDTDPGQQPAGESSDQWLDDRFIADAVDDAADELLLVDESKMSVDRIDGADAGAPITDSPQTETGQSPADRLDTESDEAPKLPPVADSPPGSSSGDIPPPLALMPVSRFDDTDLLADGVAPDTTYRLKIGDNVYGDIDAEGLISLFHRGIWVVADEIAEDDGPWMPVESHPIFDRLRHVIADGVTNLLLTHGQLLDERSPDETDSPPGERDNAVLSEDIDEVEPPDESLTPPPVPSDSAKPTESTEATKSTQTAESTEETEQPAVTVHVSDDPEAPEETSRLPSMLRPARSTLQWTITLVATGVASAAVTYAISQPDPPSSHPHQAAAVAEPPDIIEPVEPDEPPREHIAPTDVTDAVDRAAGHVADATDGDPVALAQQALRDGDYDAARNLAIQIYAQSPDTDGVQQIFDRAVSEDPAMHRQLRTIAPDIDADALAPITEGASITLRFLEDDEELYAYKADREEWRDGWRVEIAAYKLCKIIDCNFDFPTNEPARISREAFDELYERIDSPVQQAYADRRFDELIWHDEEGPDGIERPYLYGVLKEWIPHYTRWPIEHVDTWARWLDVEQREQVLQEEVDDYLQRLNDVYEGRFVAGLARETDGYTARHLAHQLSNLHVFDYLTTNYDRYSGIEEYYGVNAHFADGRFVPIDNSAAFQRVDLRVPLMDRRIRNVSRFSKSIVAATRLLRPEVVNPILFPEPLTAREQNRLDIFWQQRDKFLTYVDELVEDYGEEAVYAFD